MPALPWQQMRETDPNQEYVVMSSRLPLRAYRFIPGFLRDTLRIRRQLGAGEGLVGYGLNAELFRKTFWTYSVWADRESLEAFARSEPHRQIMARLGPHMGESRFEFFTLRGSEIPKDWHQMQAPVAS